METFFFNLFFDDGDISAKAFFNELFTANNGTIEALGGVPECERA